MEQWGEQAFKFRWERHLAGFPHVECLSELVIGRPLNKQDNKQCNKPVQSVPLPEYPSLQMQV